MRSHRNFSVIAAGGARANAAEGGRSGAGFGEHTVPQDAGSILHVADVAGVGMSINYRGGRYLRPQKKSKYRLESLVVELTQGLLTAAAVIALAASHRLECQQTGHSVPPDTDNIPQGADVASVSLTKVADAGMRPRHTNQGGGCDQRPQRQRIGVVARILKRSKL